MLCLLADNDDDYYYYLPTVLVSIIISIPLKMANIRSSLNVTGYVTGYASIEQHAVLYVPKLGTSSGIRSCRDHEKFRR